VGVGTAVWGVEEAPTKVEARVEPWERRRDAPAAVALFVLTLLVYLLTANYTLNQVNDTVATSVSAWSLGTRGTLALPDTWPDDTNRWFVEGQNGGTYTDRFPGPTLWAAPFYTMTEWVSPRGTPPHPYLADYAPAGVAAAFAAALAVTAAFAVYRRVERRTIALAAAGFLALGTGMWSVAADAMWTHGIGSLLLLLGVLGTSSRRYVWAGIAFGLAILCRPQYAVIPAVIGLWEGFRLRDLAPVVKVGLPSAAGLLSMSLYSQAIFGTWLPVAGYSTGKVSAVASTGGGEFLENLVYGLGHPLRGLLFYTPLLLLLLPGVDRGWKVAPAWVRSAAVGGLLYAVVQLRANGWTGGADYFGSRLLIELLVLASPLLLLTFRHYVPVEKRGVRLSLVVILSAAVVMHAAGATVMRTGVGGPDTSAAWEQRLATFCEERPQTCDWR
jgi:hypothetical protein